MAAPPTKDAIKVGPKTWQYGPAGRRFQISRIDCDHLSDGHRCGQPAQWRVARIFAAERRTVMHDCAHTDHYCDAHLPDEERYRLPENVPGHLPRIGPWR